MRKTLKWFTLIEMLIVIVIIGILAAVLIPKIGWAREKAENVAVKANVRSYAQWVLQMQLANDTAYTAYDTIAALDTSANAEKYGFTHLNATDQANYTFNYNSTSKKFLVCGKVTEWGNSNTTALDANGKRTEATEWTATEAHCSDNSNKDQTACEADWLTWIEATDGTVLIWYCYMG